MLKKRHCLDILIFLILGTAAVHAEDLVVPSFKSPYTINDAQFDNSGDYFAYEVNGKVYVRDSLSLQLKDTFARNEESDLSAFYNYSGRVDYPATKVITNGNNVTIQTKASASSPVETKTLDNLPARAKTAAVNKARTHMAFLGDDGNAYVYDLGNSTQVSKTPYNSSTNGLSFTKDNKLLFSDSSRTVGLYNTNGQKIKTYTTANSIKGLNLSKDEETLIVYDTNGILNFYNTSSANQLGYVPNLGSKLIKNVQLSKDSRRLIVTGENNTLYIVPTQDVLFSQNKVAPTPKQFVINYNALNPNDRGTSGITEFGIKEYYSSVDDTDAEYILSTQEKALGKQNFELDTERIQGESVVIANQPDQALFPPSVIEGEKEYDFSDKSDYLAQNKVYVQEYKQPQNHSEQLNIPGYDPLRDSNRITQTIPETSRTTVPGTTTPGTIVPVPVPNQNGISGTGSTATGGNGTTVNGQGVPGNITIIINGGSGSENTSETTTTTTTTNTETAKTPTRAELKAQEKAEKEAAKLAKEEEKQRAKEEAKKAKEEEKKAKEKAKEEEKADETERKSPLEEKLKEKFNLTDDEIKSKFKDGHGIIINAGFSFMPDPYLIDIRLVTGYRNYNLIRPCYFGGNIEPYVAIPKANFPFEYQVNGTYTAPPKLLGVRGYAPIGFAIYPLNNSLEIFAELDLGMSVNWLMNGQLGSYYIKSSCFPAFYSAMKLGAAWDFINLSLCGVYDAMFGITFSAELGVCINLGGSRNVGGSRLK